MQNVNKEIIDSVIKNARIVDVVGEFLSLTKKGNNYLGLCPFHSDSSPSFTVNEQKGIYKCFACNEGGNSATFLMKKLGITFYEALEKLANMQGIELNLKQFNKQGYSYNPEDAEIIELLNSINTFYKFELIKSVDPNIKNFLKNRHLDNQIILNKFDIGYAPENQLINKAKEFNYSEEDLVKAGLINPQLYEIFKNRITFGIRNNNGDLVGFSARALAKSENAKYINSPETRLFNKSQILYNYHNAKNKIQQLKEVIIVEGFMDAIACYKAGIENVVAVMGTALTKQHLNVLKNNKIVLFFDNDTAGLKATIRSVELILQEGMEVFVIENNFEKDADEILHHHQNGRDDLINLIFNNRCSAIDFVYRKLQILHNLDVSPEYSNIKLFASELMRIFANAQSDQIKYLINLVKKDFNYDIEFDFEKKNQIQASNNFSDYKEKDLYIDDPISYDQDQHLGYIPEYVPGEFEPQFHGRINDNWDTEKVINELEDFIIMDNRLTLLIRCLSNDAYLQLFINELQSKEIYEEAFMWDDQLATDELLKQTYKNLLMFCKFKLDANFSPEYENIIHQLFQSVEQLLERKIGEFKLNNPNFERIYENIDFFEQTSNLKIKIKNSLSEEVKTVTDLNVLRNHIKNKLNLILKDSIKAFEIKNEKLTQINMNTKFIGKRLYQAISVMKSDEKKGE